METPGESACESDHRNPEAQTIPAYMTALMRRQFLQEMVKTLPETVQNRIVALKNIQLEHLKMEAEFFQEVYKLEKKYQEKYQPLFDRRKEIVVGQVDPPKEDPKWNTEEDEDDEFPNEQRPPDFASVLKKYNDIDADAKGIPNFWLTIFRNTELLSEMVQPHDEPALAKLIDITIKYDDEYSYTLEFHFDKNDYFTNAILTKKYFLKASVDEEDPFGFEGPEIYKCEGCNIDWEKKMNLTVKTIRKKQKHKERGSVRTITKQVPNDSFFNFFNPPEVPEDKNAIDEESQGILATDFEIGHFLRARIIPKAVLYYTGDVIDDEDDDDENDGEGEGEEEDELSADNADKIRKTISSPNDCQNQ